MSHCTRRCTTRGGAVPPFCPSIPEFANRTGWPRTLVTFKRSVAGDTKILVDLYFLGTHDDDDRVMHRLSQPILVTAVREGCITRPGG